MAGLGKGSEGWILTVFLGPHRTCLGCGSLWYSWLLQLWLCMCYPTCDRRRQSFASWSDGRPGPAQVADPQRPTPSLSGGTYYARAPTPSMCPMCPHLLFLHHLGWKGLWELLAPVGSHFLSCVRTWVPCN
jgi:hypothetical protein